ncbi:MAG: glycoside hydrolase family 9 protein, partial [Planctomycetota bacterium]
HLEGVVPTTQEHLEKHDIVVLAKKVDSERAKLAIHGGHHDAGDYNPRSHIDVAEMAFLAYEVKPAAFSDGQLSIPEAHNGIPDILDEGRWALDLWVRLQDKDGGVRNGIESNGDPDMITLAEFDTKRDFTFAKEATGSLRFAACAAQAALLWEKLGRQADSQEFLKHAVKAWEWALSKDGEKHPDELALAAIQLYRAGGGDKYLEAFHAHTVFKRLPNAQLDEYQKYDQRDASFYYAFCTRPVDAALKQKILAAFKQKLDYWAQCAETTGYRYMRSPYAPNNWGTGCHPKWLVDAIEGYTLLKDPSYLKWIVLTCDFALGCHPMNRVFTTRLGQRCISAPLHMFSRYAPDGPIAGIQCQGPSSQAGGQKASGSMSSWIGAMLYPAGPWPELQTYTDIVMSPGMNEGVVADQIKSAVAYAFLLPER